MEEEIWRDIVGYEGKYQVSNLGNVRGLNYLNSGKAQNLKLKLNKNSGLLEACLWKDGKRHFFTVQRLVAIHFIPNPMCKPKVSHISKDRLDNRVQNLFWTYNSEANHHTYNKGTRSGSTNTKITYNGKKYKKYSDIAKDLKINRHTFYKRINRLNWGLYEALEIPVGKVKK